jgi:hypothetical protein
MRELLAAFERQGFVSQFAACEQGRIECVACHHVIDAGIADVRGFRRLEGASDPDDMVAVVALVCPRCRSMGTMVLGFGPMATEEDSEVMERLPEAPPPEADGTGV